MTHLSYLIAKLMCAGVKGACEVAEWDGMDRGLAIVHTQCKLYNYIILNFCSIFSC